MKNQLITAIENAVIIDNPLSTRLKKLIRERKGNTSGNNRKRVRLGQTVLTEIIDFLEKSGN